MTFRIHFSNSFFEFIDSIKPSMQSSYLYFGFVDLEGSTFYRIFYSQQRVLCGSRIKSSRLHFSVVIFLLVIRDQWLQYILYWDLSTSQAGARGRERCCTFHYLSWTDSINPSLKLLYIIVTHYKSKTLYKKCFGTNCTDLMMFLRIHRTDPKFNNTN